MRRADTASRRRDNRLAAALLLVVAAAPLPLGGNRPALWAAWTCLLALIACAYAVQLIASERELPVTAARFRLPGGLFLVLCAWLVIQVVPVAGWVGLGTMRAGDATLSTPSLSLTPGDTMLMLVRWLGYGLAFFLFAQAGRSRSRALVAVKALHAICLIYAALGLAMLILFGDTQFSGSRSGPIRGLPLPLSSTAIPLRHLSRLVSPSAWRCLPHR